MADPSADLEHVFGAAYRLPATGSTTLGRSRRLVGQPSHGSVGPSPGLVSPRPDRVGPAPDPKGGEMRLGTLLLIIIIVLLVLYFMRGRRGRL
jgi:hypothetical protein